MLPVAPASSPPGRPRLLLLVFVLLLSSHSSLAAIARCPVALHTKCTCSVDLESRVSVFCDGIPASTALPTLAAESIDSLRLSNCDLSVLSDPLLLSSLRSLEIFRCGLTTISDSALVPVADSLQELIVVSNNLTTLPLFRSLPKLVNLNLNDNQIRDIPDGSLVGLPSLRQLRVEDNDICSLSSNALNESKGTLELLDLSGNCLPAIPAQALRNSAKLMYLDLSSNKITEIGNFNLMNLPVLRELRLNDNLLNRIHPMAFMNVPELQFLYMRNNLISDLDGNRLQAFKQLEILDVSNNMLSKLPSFKDLSNLKQIRLDGNLISKVDTLAFASNPRLQLISLQDNNISLIARNSFDSLDQLVILLLTNNSIKSIERGMLDGMKNLQQLNLRNNSLTEIDNSTFSSLRQMTTLDLAHNQIRRIAKGTFEKQSKLFWLDLSNNKLVGFEKATFDKRISNFLLSGNPLECDDELDWFVQWLVLNRVRTFLPAQPEILCAGPPKYAGVRLKELMMRKANDTIIAATRNFGLSPDGAANQKSILGNFLPGLSGIGNGQAGPAIGGLGGLPVLSQITNAIPSLRSVPGFGGPPPGGAAMETREMNSAIEQFAGPLVRFATGGQPVAADLEQLIQSIPNLIVNVPGYGDIDVSKLPPHLVAHVLRGGQIPGIPKETLDRIVNSYMERMSQMAEAAKRGERPPDMEKYLPPLERLPHELVTSVINGGNLPGLNESQTAAIKEYYTAQIPVGGALAGAAQPGGQGSPPAFAFSAEAIEMMKLLPPGYNLSRIPAKVMESLSRGEVPDLNLLPEDLQQHLRVHSNKMLSMFSDKNGSIEDLLAKLPRWERPVLPTFSPYDINQLNSDLIFEEEQVAKASRLRIYTAIALGSIGALSVVVIVCLVIYMKRSRAAGAANAPIFRPCGSSGSPMSAILANLPPPLHHSSPKEEMPAGSRDQIPSYISVRAPEPPTTSNALPPRSSQLHFHQA